MYKYKIRGVNLSCLILLACFLLFLNGCATVQHPIAAPLPINIPGTYHRVKKGQTLWRISKIYNMDLDEIVRINRIPDATAIEIGQLIFIPREQTKQSITKSYSSGEDFGWPVKGRIISTFGQTFNDMINKGINIQKHKGADIMASRSGKVVFYSSEFEDFGKTIIIDHGDGFLTIYAKIGEVFVKAGEYVQKGSVIAKVGSLGNDKDAYLHFQIRKGYIAQNPYFYLPR